MGCIADQIPFRTSPDVAGETIATEAVDDFHKTPLPNRRSGGRYIKLEELPVARGGVKALLTLNHDLGRHELEHRTYGVKSASHRLRHLGCTLEVPNQIVHIEAPDVRHLRHATKRLFADREGGRPGVSCSSHRRASQQRGG